MQLRNIFINHIHTSAFVHFANFLSHSELLFCNNQKIKVKAVSKKTKVKLNVTIKPKKI